MSLTIIAKYVVADEGRKGKKKKEQWADDIKRGEDWTIAIGARDTNHVRTEHARVRDPDQDQTGV